MNLEALRAPLKPDEIEWRVSRKANGFTTVVPYITARTVMERLDEAVGPENWQIRYRELLLGEVVGVVAELAIRNPDTGEWIVKSDGAEPGASEPFKGALSAALKRAAIHWGIGRELYHFPTVQIRGEYKYVPAGALRTLQQIAKRFLEGAHLPDLIRITADGKPLSKAA